MKKIKNKLGKLLDVTFSEKILSKYGEDELRRIRLVNYITLISIFNMVLYIIVYCFLNFQLFKHAIVFLSIGSIINIGIIIINKRGAHQSAKILLATFTPFFMSYIATVAFGKAPGFQVYLLVAAIIPLFLWSNKQKRYPIVFICTIITLYAIIEFSPNIFEPKILLPENYIYYFRLTNIAVCFIAAGFAIGTYQFLYRKQEERLVKQTEQLKISQAHKDKVYSIIAHDLRGPFGTFASLTEIFIKNYNELSDERRLEVIQSIHQTSSSMQNLLENLLDWSKMQSGYLKKTLEHLKLRKLVEDSMAINKELIMKKNQKIDININDDISVFADHYMVLTIFRNLISNATKFTKPQGKITISAEENNEKIQICVEDSGIGMSDKELKYLFNIMKTDKIHTNTYIKGSGLGLVLCKDFVENHEGEIWVESELGKGSKFCFTLPKS
ncbi:sensor histidine kinase [Bacteroidota bacterium]